ncbi:hypothetical protein RSAG8_00897, partial [Rhizoctonia solani AG-8 WAC10335]
MPRATTPKGKSRHDPHHVQIGEDETYAKFGRVSAGKQGKKRKSENEEELEKALDTRTSRKIFDLAKDQQEELDLVDDEGNEKDVDDEADSDEQLNAARTARVPTMQDSDDEDENEYPDEEYEELEVGQLLNHYKSGPLPKPFKVLPSLPQWARLLALTKPHEWTPHAHYAATRMLVSNLKPESVRHYLEGVLLEAVRDDIRINGKLNVHLYDALKKAVYKPAAFFKGIVFPLCETGCTLKEAAIVASVLMKVSVPNLHSAAALLRLASMDYSGPNSLFIRILLDKKYALPYKVVDGLVFHFIRIANTHKGSRAEGDKLPVLWHQSLLVFCQRYASDLSPDQKDSLLDVIRAHPHAQIGPEIRRELINAASKSTQRDNDVEMH